MIDWPLTVVENWFGVGDEWCGLASDALPPMCAVVVDESPGPRDVVAVVVVWVVVVSSSSLLSSLLQRRLSSTMRRLAPRDMAEVTYFCLF